MDRNTAERLMAIYERLGAVLNEADPVVRSIADEAERAELLRGLGDMMGHLWFKLQLPVVRQYPDLDPDGDTYRPHST